jgi:hypothetical protein
MLFFSCGGGSDENKVFDQMQETTDTIPAEAIVNLGLMRVNIPSPTIVMKAVSDANLKFDKSIVNSTGNAGKYATNYQAALNLGVYGADLAYLSTYNQTQDVLEYLNQVRKLSEKIGIASAFDQEFVEEVSSNISNSDTLPDLINIAYQKAEKNLRSNERVSLAAVIIAGGWVEGLYIATHLLKNNPSDEVLNSKIWNHIYSFKYLENLLEQFKGNPECDQAMESLREVTKALKPYIGKPSLGGEDIPDIHTQIAEARNKFVG